MDKDFTMINPIMNSNWFILDDFGEIMVVDDHNFYFLITF